VLRQKKLILILLFLTITINYAFAQITTFAIIGDYGTAGSNEADVANEVKSWNPDFVVTVGDNIYGGANGDYSEAVGKDYHQFMFPHDATYGGSDTTTVNHFWPVVGNHDWSENNLQNYLDYFTLPNNERYYTIQIGDIEFFAIDSEDDEPDGTSSTSTQGLWIKDKIQNSTAKWKIVLSHHPAYTSNGSYSYMQWPFEDWGVDAFIGGHIHNYERILKDDNNDGKDLVYFVNGLGGAGRKDLPKSFIDGSEAQYDDKHGAMKVTETSSSLVFEFINKNGDLIDTYTFDSPTPVELVFLVRSISKP